MHAEIIELNWSFFFQIINTLIIFFILSKVLFKPIRNHMVKREEDIAGAIDHANQLIVEAERFKSEYEEKLDEYQLLGREILQNAKDKSDDYAKRIVHEAQEHAAKLALKAKEDMEREKQLAMIELKNQIGEIAILIAEKILKERLDQPGQEAMIHKIIKELESTKWQN